MECQKKFGNKNVTGTICETKWKTLKRTYKTITLNNKTSGQNRRHWEYYTVMHKIMFTKPESNSVATCSSMSGLHVSNNNVRDIVGEKSSSSSNNILNEDVNIESDNTPAETSFGKKRRYKSSGADQRHKVKLARMDRFNDLFATMVEKMGH